MARRKYLKDYRIVETLNKRGGIQTCSEYIGQTFHFRDAAEAERMKKTLPILCVLGWLAYIAALLPNSSAGSTAYVSLPFLFLAIPNGMLSERAVALLLQKPPLERRSADRFNNWVPGASLVITILAGLSLVGEAVNCFFGYRPVNRGDMVFAISALVLCACGVLLRRLCRRVETEQDP